MEKIAARRARVRLHRARVIVLRHKLAVAVEQHKKCIEHGAAHVHTHHGARWQ